MHAPNCMCDECVLPLHLGAEAWKERALASMKDDNVLIKRLQQQVATLVGALEPLANAVEEVIMAGLPQNRGGFIAYGHLHTAYAPARNALTDLPAQARKMAAVWALVHDQMEVTRLCVKVRGCRGMNGCGYAVSCQCELDAAAIITAIDAAAEEAGK